MVAGSTGAVAADAWPLRELSEIKIHIMHELCPTENFWIVLTIVVMFVRGKEYATAQTSLHRKFVGPSWNNEVMFVS